MCREKSLADLWSPVWMESLPTRSITRTPVVGCSRAMPSTAAAHIRPTSPMTPAPIVPVRLCNAIGAYSTRAGRQLICLQPAAVILSHPRYFLHSPERLLILLEAEEVLNMIPSLWYESVLEPRDLYYAHEPKPWSGTNLFRSVENHLAAERANIFALEVSLSQLPHSPWYFHVGRARSWIRWREAACRESVRVAAPDGMKSSTRLLLLSLFARINAACVHSPPWAGKLTLCLHIQTFWAGLGKRPRDIARVDNVYPFPSVGCCDIEIIGHVDEPFLMTKIACRARSGICFCGFCGFCCFRFRMHAEQTQLPIPKRARMALQGNASKA